MVKNLDTVESVRTIDVNELAEYVRTLFSCTKVTVSRQAERLVIEPEIRGISNARRAELCKNIPVVEFYEGENGWLTFDHEKYPREKYPTLYDWIENG
jgi:hypothetical protein